MGLFTKLDAAQLAGIAASFRLGAVRAAEGIAAGTVNSNYRLTTNRGVWFVRVNEGKSEEDVGYEAELVAWLAERGVVTPRPVVAEDGRPWARTPAGLITLFPWAAGAHVAARAIGPAEARQAGGALAALHVAGRDFPRRRVSHYTFEAIRDRWRALPRSDGALGDAIDDTGEEIAWLTFQADARAALPAGVIHGDLFPDNVLFEGGRLAALLDFEQASDGTLAYDLAVCLCSWCYGDDFVPDRARALLDGYQAVRRLEPAERVGLYIETRAAAMRFTVTRITDVHLNAGASEVVKRTKDYRRYHARLRSVREMGEDGFAKLIED